MSESITQKTVAATKWSVITELVAKCITPITSMILARILAPEAFGVLTTVLMVVAFAEVFVESGFQKYLIQHIFASKEQEENYMSVAFWANLAFSLFIWGVIAVFNNEIAELVGNSGKGFLIVITGVTIPLYSIIGIQSCKLKKDLNFKKLFYVRIASSLVPIVVTIPLALLGMDYWALIIGNIAGIAVQLITLIAVRAFKPHFYFSWLCLKEMLSYGIWTILNGLAVWLTSWVDAFLIGRLMSDYYLGLYKNSTSMMTSIFSIVTASIVPVLFSSLSKLQNDEEGFKNMFLNIQRALSLFLLPLGMGMLFYRSFVTDVLFGPQWMEASDIIGITAITTVFRTLYVSLNGDVFRAKGKFSVPLFLQIADLILTIPMCYLALKHNFWTFVYVRSLSKLILIVPEIYYIRKICKITVKDQLMNSWHYYIATAIMSVMAIVFQSIGQTIAVNIVGIISCMIIYVVVLLSFPRERKDIINIVNRQIKR